MNNNKNNKYAVSSKMQINLYGRKRMYDVI